MEALRRELTNGREGLINTSVFRKHTFGTKPAKSCWLYEMPPLEAPPFLLHDIYPNRPRSSNVFSGMFLGSRRDPYCYCGSSELRSLHEGLWKPEMQNSRAAKPWARSPNPITSTHTKVQTEIVAVIAGYTVFGVTHRSKQAMGISFCSRAKLTPVSKLLSLLEIKLRYLIQKLLASWWFLRPQTVILWSPEILNVF